MCCFRNNIYILTLSDAEKSPKGYFAVIVTGVVAHQGLIGGCRQSVQAPPALSAFRPRNCSSGTRSNSQRRRRGQNVYTK
jgi:hypothetical protein